jgi:hypothetical protein
MIFRRKQDYFAHGYWAAPGLAKEARSRLRHLSAGQVGGRHRRVPFSGYKDFGVSLTGRTRVLTAVESV